MLLTHSGLGTIVAPLNVLGFEFYLGVPKFYFYTGLSYAYSFITQPYHDLGESIYVKGGFGGHIYNKSDRTLVMNGGVLFSVTYQNLVPNYFDNPKGHRTGLGLGGFVNLRIFHYFHKYCHASFDFNNPITNNSEWIDSFLLESTVIKGVKTLFRATLKLEKKTQKEYLDDYTRIYALVN